MAKPGALLLSPRLLLVEPWLGGGEGFPASRFQVWWPDRSQLQDLPSEPSQRVLLGREQRSQAPPPHPLSPSGLCYELHAPLPEKQSGACLFFNYSRCPHL